MALAWCGCSSGDPVARLTSQLGESAHRERAIDAMLILVRQTPAKQRAQVKQRVVNALMEAYREDTARPQIVAALALLKDGRAEEVFVAALKDAERGGPYFEASVRSARMIGELGLKKQVPVLLKSLEQRLASPRDDRNTWLERSLIQALERLADRRAVPVLIKALKADPARMDFYISRMAAHALGTLRDARAVDALVASLGATSHGLLLYEESRRALCRIGAPSIKGLSSVAWRRDRRQRPVANAPAAVRLLADLGAVDLTTKLMSLPRPDDPAELRLAVAQTLLRLGRRDADRLALDLVQDQKSSVTSRRCAADLLGWYGAADSVAPLLAPSCSKADAAGQLLCWSVALAHSRVAGAEGTAALDKLLATRQDEATRHHLGVCRARLAMVTTCADQPGCYERQLTSAADWREQERAALELGRSGSALPLARHLAQAHPQVKQAILVGLEQQQLQPPQNSEVRQALRALIDSKVKDTGPHGVTPPAIVGRALCLDERLERTREKR